MELVKWNPSQSLFVLSNHLERIFDHFFYPTRWDDAVVSTLNWSPVVDVYDDKDRLVITADLPGVEKKDIHIDVKDGVLTLKGDRSSDNETKEDRFYRRERSYGTFERSFTLPADVDPDKITATYKEGVLKLEIQKPEEKTPKQITIH